MPDQHIHIVCLDVPYPPDYGGVFDLFYKIKALHAKGILIHLHCFEYGRGRQQKLDRYCVSVNYYNRQGFLKTLFLRVPHIVSSRANKELIQNLEKDNYPVLLEGIHCTWFLYAGKLQARKVVVRLHNVEFEYYKELAYATDNFLKRMYFKRESRLLKKYEQLIAGKCTFIAVSEQDQNTYQQVFKANDVKYLPVFLPFSDVTSPTGSGNFCLYHGNLSVSENEKAAIWLIENVFSSLKIPLTLAGKNPSEKLVSLASRHTQVSIFANPSEQEINNLITDAHVHVLPAFNKTGVKIKLLHALFNGRHVVTNSAGVKGTQLENICLIADTAKEFSTLIHELMGKSFDITERDRRKNLLGKIFNNDANAIQLMRWLS